MRIYDKSNNLISIYKRFDEISDSKEFLTEHDNDFQFGTFNLQRGEIIKKHIHNKQERKVSQTSEGIVVLSGSLEVDFFDENENFIEKIILNQGDSVLILSGGHGINVLDDCKFIEFKQGPYIPDIDKKHF